MKRLWGHRHLLVSLTRRTYQLRYRQSMAGFVWAILPPLITVGAATVVFDTVVGVDTGGTPYPIFAFAALVPWSFLASSLTSGVPSVVQAQQMVSRFAFPRAVLPLSMVGVALIDFAIAIVAFVGFAYITRAGIPLTALWVPAILLVEILLVMGVVLLASALNVFMRDIKLGIVLLTQVWLFVTPVMYPLSTVPEGLRPFYVANPMTGVVDSFRRILVLGQAPDFGHLLPAIVGSLILLVVGAWYFTATERRFADVI